MRPTFVGLELVHPQARSARSKRAQYLAKHSGGYFDRVLSVTAFEKRAASLVAHRQRAVPDCMAARHGSPRGHARLQVQSQGDEGRRRPAPVGGLVKRVQPIVYRQRAVKQPKTCDFASWRRSSTQRPADAARWYSRAGDAWRWAPGADRWSAGWRSRSASADTSSRPTSTSPISSASTCRTSRSAATTFSRIRWNRSDRSRSTWCRHA